MDVQLQSPQQSFCMLDGHTTQEETTMILHYHDVIFKNASILNDKGKPIFRIEGSPSWSWKRKIFNSAGDRLLFDFRHESSDVKDRWKVEDPNGREMCSLAYEKQTTSAVEATVHTLAGEDVLVLMRPQSCGSVWTSISVGGATIATICRFVDNARIWGNTNRNKDQTAWVIHVAAGVDLSMITVLALSRAEMAHVWKQ
ncbi:hypothetical protein F4678DRAFT_402983 [Xylaria arbuscula]|nr:hypothetical protein F4678DRAFT_402983 [Xylaria arbuscula]